MNLEIGLQSSREIALNASKKIPADTMFHKWKRGISWYCYIISFCVRIERLAWLVNRLL